MADLLHNSPDWWHNNLSWRHKDITLRHRNPLYRHLRGITKQLVPNPGDPFSDLMGWAAFFQSTLSLDSGELRVTNDASSTQQGRAVTAISTPLGQRFIVEASRSGEPGQEPNAALDLSNNSDGSGAFASENMPIREMSSLEFTATAETTYISLRIGGSTEDEYIQFVGVTARRVA